MRWESDASVGAWLGARMDAGLSASMHGYVPRGFECYLRVLHPSVVSCIPGGSMPTPEEWARMRPDEFERQAATVVAEPSRWAEAAAAFGTVLHPLAQWHRIVGMPGDQDDSGGFDPNGWQQRLTADGREFSAPTEGDPGPDLLAAVMRHLAPEQASGYAAVWEGWGGLLGSTGTNGRAFLSFDDVFGDSGGAVNPRHEAMLAASRTDPLNDGVLSAKWHDGILPRSVSEGPRLQLPARAHVLFSGDLHCFATSAWPLTVPWRDLPAEQHGMPPAAHAPALLWPEDRSWVLVSEIDLDSTVICGSRAQLSAIADDPAVEAFFIPVDADLTWNGDRING